MSDRSMRCVCGGLVSVPTRRRTITLDEVMANHLEACPAPQSRALMRTIKPMTTNEMLAGLGSIFRVPEGDHDDDAAE
jgi:hypothetical protein